MIELHSVPRVVRRVPLAILLTFGLPVVAAAEPCDLDLPALSCDEVDVRGKLFIDGEMRKVTCKSDPSSWLAFLVRRGDLRGTIVLGDPAESCKALVDHAILPERDGRGYIPLLGSGQPQRVSRSGKPRNECLVQATVPKDESELGATLGSLQGSWKFDKRTGQPTSLKAALATQYVPHATGVSGRFIGTLKAKGCSFQVDK